MPNGRDVLGSVGVAAAAALVGRGGIDAASATNDGGSGVRPTHESGGTGPIGSVEEAVAYVRNVEEVRGHLASSATLLERGRREDAAVHAKHPTDYFGAILPRLRDVDPDLATRLRARLRAPGQRIGTAEASAYRTYIDEQVLPALDRAVEAVVPEGTRTATGFGVRVMNALAGRIADEYAAAVPEAGSIELVGEYWDARGFLVRIEERYADVESALGGAGGDALGQLRTGVEDVAVASEVIGTTLAFRVATAAAADLPSARVEDRAEAVTYVRNLEEVRGHLASSMALIDAGDESAAAFHAGHAADYIATLLPPVRRADPELADRLLTRLLAVDERIGDGYREHVTGRVMPMLDRVPSVAVPDEYVGRTSFDAAVILALARRIEDEYAAAVTEDEVIELYGEYWDARGFLARIEERFERIESDLDGETAESVSGELDVLRTELETAATPADVAGSVEALEAALGDVAEG
ncbi:MAG: hypothetical protein ABEH40_01350 [Haloferacaceae archaeon]